MYIRIIIQTFLFNHFIRFLSQLCEPIMGENDVGVKSKVDLLRKINVGIKAIAFQCSLEGAENYFPSENDKGLIASCGEGKETSDLQYLLDSMASCVYHLNVRNVLQKCLFISLRGNSAKEMLMLYLDTQLGESAGIPEELWWIGEDLLAKPLLETFVLGLILDRSAYAGSIVSSNLQAENIVLNGDFVITFFRWICIARLIQLILKEVSEEVFTGSTTVDDTAVTHSKMNDDDDPSTTSFGKALISVVNRLIQKVLDTAFSRHRRVVVPEDRVFKIIHSWCLFIRNAATIVHKCRPGLIPPISMDSDDSLIQFLQSDDGTGLSSCLESASNFVLQNFGNLNLFSEAAIVECCKGVDIWMKAVPCDSSFVSKIMKVVTNDYYATIQKPRLKALPDSYTKLHGLIVNACDYEYPAICLVCGQVLDAGGSGGCTEHTTTCCPEGGVIFLLQDCTILLMYASRASYFTSPYIDSHGEKHRHFKGRPLHLDEKR